MTADDSYNRLDDDDYPAYTMGRAAEILGTTQAFLRAIGEARLITPLRSPGGHRRYSRYQLRIAARARELEDQLEEAQRINEHLRGSTPRDRATA
jgi:DNA-binding transcriptional MerR regulator